MAERGREAADLLVRVIRDEVRPVTAFRPLPLFWSAACQVTAHPPIDEAFRLVHGVESRPGILSVTLSTGFPWADVPQMGASVIVVADADPRLARATADEIGDWVWERRERWFRHPQSVREGLEQGKLSILLRGEKVKGSFALVRAREGWLLIKHKDRFAGEHDVTVEDRSVLSGLSLEDLKAHPVRRLPAERLAACGERESMPSALAPMH